MYYSNSSYRELSKITVDNAEQFAIIISMTKQEITALACRMLALYIAIESIAHALMMLSYEFQNSYVQIANGAPLNLGAAEMSGIFFILLFPFLLSFIIWISADWLSLHIVTVIKDPHAKTALSALEVQTVFISLAGLFLIMEACMFVLSSTSYQLYVLSTSPANVSPLQSYLQWNFPRIIQLCLGGFLVVKSSKVAHFLQRRFK